MTTYKPDQLMLQNYLQNKLAPKDEERLELWLADNPDALEDMELDLVMKRGVNLHDTMIKDNRDYRTDWFNWLKPVVWATSFSFVLLTGALIYSVLFDNKFNVSHISSPDTIVLTQMRSNVDAKITISKSMDSLIQIPVDYLSEDQYSVLISNQQGFKLVLETLKPKLDMVSLLIPKDYLKTGDYQLNLKNQNTAEQSNYHFTVID